VAERSKPVLRAWRHLAAPLERYEPVTIGPGGYQGDYKAPG